jgi:hypothetical protein
MIKIGLLIILIIGLLFLFYKNRSVSEFTSNTLPTIEKSYQDLGSGNWLDLPPTMDCWSNSNDGGYKGVMTKDQSKQMCANDHTCRGIRMVSTNKPNNYSVWFVNNNPMTNSGTSKGVTCSVFKR